MATMTADEAIQALKDAGSLFAQEDGYHFVGVSGNHLAGYCNIDPLLPHADVLSRMTETIVAQFKDDDIETVFVPAIGAIPMGAWGPHHLQAMSGKAVQGVWADKIKPRGFIIERDGFAAALKGKRVLILEDMINRMFSVKELVRLAREAEAEVVGVGSIASNRGVTAEAIGVAKLFSLCEVGYDTWDEANCELCKQRVPVVIDMGHGDEFATAHPDYPTRTLTR